MEGLARRRRTPSATLWDPQQQSGLLKRRRDEATLWRSGFAALQLD
jgi:hypothetical protein